MSSCVGVRLATVTEDHEPCRRSDYRWGTRRRYSRLESVGSGLGRAPATTGRKFLSRRDHAGTDQGRGGRIASFRRANTVRQSGYAHNIASHTFLPRVAGKPTTATKKRKRNRQSDVHRQPPRPSARRQDLEEDRGRDHHHSLYSCEATATFAGGSGVKSWCVHSRACRGFLVINLGGICSYVGKHRRWDDYYRNDSLRVVSRCCAVIES